MPASVADQPDRRPSVITSIGWLLALGSAVIQHRSQTVPASWALVGYTSAMCRHLLRCCPGSRGSRGLDNAAATTATVAPDARRDRFRDRLAGRDFPGLDIRLSGRRYSTCRRRVGSGRDGRMFQIRVNRNRVIAAGQRNPKHRRPAGVRSPFRWRSAPRRPTRVRCVLCVPSRTNPVPPG